MSNSKDEYVPRYVVTKLHTILHDFLKYAAAPPTDNMAGLNPSSKWGDDPDGVFLSRNSVFKVMRWKGE